MATTAVISDTFSIYLQTDAAAGHVITNPGRAFKILNISAYNAGGTPNITVAHGGGTVAALQAVVANGWKDLTLDPAQLQVTAVQNITVTNANVSTTAVVIECIAYSGYTLGVT